MDDLIDHSMVTAVIVTRGDVELQPILATIPYDDLIVWDNSKSERDAGVYGRYLGAEDAANEIIYFQDDDIVFTAHDRMRDAYEPGQITSNMPSPWYERTGYDVAGCGMVGAGSLMPKGLWKEAFRRYLEIWPEDDMFLNGCDWVNGILTPHKRYDFGYTILPHAETPGRISTSPSGPELRREMIERASNIRDAG